MIFQHNGLSKKGRFCFGQFHCRFALDKIAMIKRKLRSFAVKLGTFSEQPLHRDLTKSVFAKHSVHSTGYNKMVVGEVNDFFQKRKTTS